LALAGLSCRLLFTELLGQTFISVAPPRAAEAGAADGAPTALWGAALGAAAGPASALAGTFTDMVQADKAAAADVGGSPLAAVGAVALVLGGAALLLGGDDGGAVNDKKVVKDYFNNEGFQRWQKIYGETDDVNPVQKDIRVGHAQTVDKILNWLDPSTIVGKTVCDAGCGTGNLSIPLASRGALVTGSDISSAMVGEAEKRAKEQLKPDQMPKFFASDLEALDGEFDTVCCVDVLIHYPPERLDSMVGGLAKLGKERVILSFAPKTWYYTLLKRIGELFPGPAKTTRAYLHEEEVVEAAFRKAGYEVTRKELTATNFYFSRLFEAKPVGSS